VGPGAGEEIGRHNAVNKVNGRLLLDGRLPADGLGFVSGPSALAVRTARAAGLTLVGFARGSRMNLYAPAPLSEG